MTLPAFAAAARRPQLSIDNGCRHRRSAANPPAACGPPLLSIDGTDRLTDGRTPDRYIDATAARIMRAVSVSNRVAARRLPSAVRTATPAFDVRSSGLCCSRPGGLELVISDYLRDPSRSADSFHRDLKTFLFSFYYSIHSAPEALRLCAICATIDTDTDIDTTVPYYCFYGHLSVQELSAWCSSSTSETD